MHFIPSINARHDSDKLAYWFIFRGNEIMIFGQQVFPRIPLLIDFHQSFIIIIRQHYLGNLDGRDCYCAEVSYDSAIPDGMTFSPLRPLLEVIDAEIFAIAGRAFQILDWDRNHQFCGRCGSRLRIKNDERAKTVPHADLCFVR